MGAGAHRQLVPEIARGGLPHAGNAQVLAEQRRRLDVEVVERDDAIERAGAGQVADALQQVVARDVAGDVEELVDRLTWPVGLLQRIDGQQQNRAALFLALAQELLPLLVRGDTQNRQRPVLRHQAALHAAAMATASPG